MENTQEPLRHILKSSLHINKQLKQKVLYGILVTDHLVPFNSKILPLTLQYNPGGAIDTDATGALTGAGTGAGTPWSAVMADTGL